MKTIKRRIPHFEIRYILLLYFPVLVFVGCAPNFPIQALKKGEISGGPIVSTNGVGACLASGASDRITLYANTMNLVHYKLGMYYKVTDSKDVMPELAANLSLSAGEIIMQDNPTYFPSTDKVLYWGLGFHSSWKLDNGTILYAVLNGYYQPEIAYWLRPGIGTAFRISDSGTLLQLDVNFGSLTTSTERKWMNLTRIYSIGLGLIM